MKKILTLCALTVLSASVSAGKDKAATCAGCHGVDGVATALMNPNLGGQHENYLYHALKSYKDGSRQNAIMQGMAAALSDQDMKDIAAFYASQKGKLSDGTLKP
jgi:cytochrome c553